MDRYRSAALGLAVVLLVAAGCAHNIWVIGEPRTEAPASIASGSSLAVRAAPGTEHEGSPLAAEVNRKVGELLEGKGFVLAPEGEAELVMFWEYSIEAVLGRMRLQPLEGPATGVKTVRQEGPFEHSLSLWVVDGELHRGGSEKIVWVGGSAMSQAPTRNTRFLDMLLVSVMQRFPEDTGGTVRDRMRLNDSRARRLRGPTG